MDPDILGWLGFIGIILLGALPFLVLGCASVYILGRILPRLLRALRVVWRESDPTKEK